LDARLIDGMAGGVQQVIIGLANELSRLTDGEEQYYFLTWRTKNEWLRPYIRGSCTILPGPEPPEPYVPPRWKKWSNDNIPMIGGFWHRLKHVCWGGLYELPSSDGIIEQAGIDVMHFTFQEGFLTSVPSIYQPHDLQHRHLPELFAYRQRITREMQYRTLCQRARVVAVMTRWGKADLIQHYDLPPEKVVVVPWGSALSAYPEPSPDELPALGRKFNLPAEFVFFPAQTWRHKNHLNLLLALRSLRDQHGLVVPLVCSGHRNEFYSVIEKAIHRHSLAEQVRFLGFVSPVELRGLYQLSRALIFPSRFEGWGLPITEAFASGTPVACSNVTSLPALAGNAALVFDPERPDEIAAAVRRLWEDESLRRALVERGRDRLKLFSWSQTARLFRAHYRRVVLRALTSEDEELLAAQPIV
jgi:glycosyltransferase involved in cell wall biosynthesis